MIKPVVEIATFRIVPGDEETFATAYHSAKTNILMAPGCRGMRMTRGVESPSTFVLMVDWDSLDAHLAFRASERFPAWRAPISPYFAEAPFVEHYADI